MARRRPHSRRAVAALDWQTPAEVVASLFELEDTPGPLRDHQTYVDAVRWARASSHTPADWLRVAPVIPRALSRLLWEVHRVGVSRPGDTAARIARGHASGTWPTTPTETPAPF